MNNMQLTIESSTTSMDLNDHQTGIYLVPELDGMTGLPEIRTSSGVNAGYDGGWTSAQNYDARLITIRGVIAHPVVSTVEAIRRQLVALVGQGHKETLTLRLTTEAGNVYTVFVRTIACTMALQRVLTSQEFQIQFRADDPLIYDDGASSGTAGILRVQRALGGFEINFELPLFIGGGSTGTPIENGGSETVYPIINLYGPLHSPTVINSTTNQQMQILADLAYENNWQTPATASGSSFQITGIEGAPLTLTELKGNATQNGTPTPDAPVAVNTTTGEQTVEIVGKNLFDKDKALDNYFYTATGSKSTYSKAQFYNNNFVATSDKITMSFSVAHDKQNGSNIEANVRIVQYDASGNFISRLMSRTNGYTFTLDANAKSFILSVDNGQDAWFDGLQVELGSTATAYEPYQGQEFEVNLGKNLFDKNNYSSTAGYFYSSDTLIGTGSPAHNILFWIPCATNTKYSITIPTGYGIITKVATSEVVPANGVAVSGSQRYETTTINGYTTGATAKYLVIYLQAPNYTIADILDDIVSQLQIELGSQATSYSAYFTPIELVKIGNYQDRIYKQDGKWYIEKQVGKVDLATLTWTGGTVRQGWIWTTTGFPNVKYVSVNTQMGAILATNFTPHTATGMYNTHGNIAIDVSNVKATDNTGASPSGQAYYALATPTTTEITNTTLLSQLNFIANLYGGTNNIMLVGTGAQGEIGVEYMTENDARRDVAVIDSQARTITINGSDAYHLKTDGSEFITIAPGTNDMILTSAQTSDEGYAEIKYKQGYLSI